MIKTMRPSILMSLALFAAVCQQTFSLELPIPTRAEQCQKDGYEGTCDFLNSDGSSEYSCTQLRCARYRGMNLPGELVHIQRYSVRKPLDGTYCGPSSFCFQGECIFSEEESERLRYTGPETRIADCI